MKISKNKVDALYSKLQCEDLSLFAHIESMLSDRDKLSLLSVQSAIRTRLQSYVYLEIGSYKGGSLQPHLLDPKCSHIYSIDKRVLIEPDERGETNYYITNSKDMMMNAIHKYFPDGFHKLTTFEADASEVDKKEILHKPDLFFIDAEHTDKAVVSDFKFCLQLMKPTSVFLFHDTHMIFSGIEKCTKILDAKKILYYSYTLPTMIGVIELHGAGVHNYPQVTEHLAHSFESYLYGMKYMDIYRSAYKKYFQNWIVSLVLRSLGKITANDLKSLRK